MVINRGVNPPLSDNTILVGTPVTPFFWNGVKSAEGLETLQDKSVKMVICTPSSREFPRLVDVGLSENRAPQQPSKSQWFIVFVFFIEWL